MGALVHVVAGSHGATPLNSVRWQTFVAVEQWPRRRAASASHAAQLLDLARGYRFRYIRVRCRRGLTRRREFKRVVVETAFFSSASLIFASLS